MEKPQTPDTDKETVTKPAAAAGHTSQTITGAITAFASDFKLVESVPADTQRPPIGTDGK